MNAAYSSSRSFGSRLWSKSIWYNTHTSRRNNFCWKTTPVHGPVHKYDLNSSYFRSHFSRIPKPVAK